LWWFGRGLDWSLVKGALQQSDWRLILLAWVIVLAAYAWRAMRWGAFLAPLCKASARELWVATTIGFGAILLVGRAGEVVRPVVLPMRDRRVRPAAAFVTIMIERVYDFMAVSLIFALSLLWFRPAAASVNDFHRVRIAGVLILGVCISGIVGLVLFRLKSDTIISGVESRLNRWSRIPFKARKAVLSLLDQLARALRILTSARELAVTIGWTALLWGSVAAANLLVFRAFHIHAEGRPFGFTETFFVLGFAMVGSAVPTPGGAAGAFHAATGAGLVFLGVEKEQAAAAAIVLHLVDFAPAATFGLYYFLRREVSFTRLRELMTSDAVEHAVEDEKIVPVESIDNKSFETVGARD
jgi:uncharacterized protein (TIRG00374 family)